MSTGERTVVNPVFDGFLIWRTCPIVYAENRAEYKTFNYNTGRPQPIRIFYVFLQCLNNSTPFMTNSINSNVNA
jgi:hypothetical protein